MTYREENSRRSGRIKPNNLKTWINSKFGSRNFQLPGFLDILVSTSHEKSCPLEDFEPAKKFPAPGRGWGYSLIWAI